MDFAHEGQGFPTCHRLYLLAWERALQEMSGDENYAIPFWDWTESEKCEICSEELLGNTSSNGNVVGKYFEKYESTRKTPLFCPLRKLPLDTTGVTSWYLFSQCIPMKSFSQSLSHLDMISRRSTKTVCKLFLLT